MLYHINKFGLDAWIDTDRIDGIGTIRNITTNTSSSDGTHHVVSLEQSFRIFLNGADLGVICNHEAVKSLPRNDSAGIATAEAELRALEPHSEIVALRNALLDAFKARMLRK